MRETKTYKFLVRIGGAVSAGIGCCALAGWLLDLPRLASLGRGFIPMAPSTAILFIVYGVVLQLADRALRDRRARLFVLSIFASGGFTSAALFFLSIRGIFLDIEHLGIQAIGAVEGSPVGHMSPIAAITFLLFSLAFPAVLSSGPGKLLRAKVAWWIAVMLVAAYIMLILAYLFGTPMFYGGIFIPPAATTSVAFVAFALALLALSQSFAWPETNRRDQESPSFSRFIIVLFIFLVAGIIAAGYFYHRNHQKQYLDGVERQLSAIADLKMGELMLWRDERMSDAGIFYRNAAFASLVKTCIQHPKSEQARREFEVWLGNLLHNHNYNRMFLLDAQGNTRLSLPETAVEPVSSSVKQKALESLRTRQIIFADFYRNEFSGKIFLSILVPVFDPSREGDALGVLVMRIDPEKYLYPFIQRWPDSSTTAETLLVRRDGNEAVALNELRFRKVTALNLRLPLERTNVIVVMAALGREGIVRGIDYRGHPVMAALRNIPDSPWHLVSRMDEEEIYAPMLERLWGTVLLISAMLLSAGTGFGFIWRQRSASYYRRSEEQVRRNKERLQCLLNIFQFESGDVKELLDFALGEALGMTSSKYGYIYYYDEIKQQFVLNCWSHDVMQACSVANPQSLYDLDKTGIWGEAVRQRSSIMINDFDAPDPLKKGYPEGHVPLTRFLTIPHFDQGKIVAVVGVANKEAAYDDSDLLQLTLLMGSVWKIAERKRVEEERNITLQRQQEINLLQQSLIASSPLESKLKDITESIVRIFDADFCKIWLIRPGDLCEQGCIHAEVHEEPHVCRYRDRCLHLLASSGRYTHVDGKVHRRVPFGCYKIGRVASGDEHKFICNDVQNDPRVHDREWAHDLGLESFAGYQLRVRDGEIIGVLALFAKHTISPDEDAMLDGLGNTVAMVIRQSVAEEARKQKEREIEEKNAELERFTYTVSHDLKSPLVTIKTFLGYLVEDIKLPDNPRVQQDLGFMHNAADKMSQLLDELLELSRVGRINNPPQKVAFKDLADEAIRLDAGRISEREVVVEVIDSPVFLSGDRSRLVEIWQNLVENAVKYIGDEPAPHIEIGCDIEDGATVFFVRDNGIGIDPRYHEKVFSLFDKLDSKSEGTGLGLALVKRIVEIYGGRIWVESKGEGHGSCFRFTLPEAVQK